jgi:phosphorylcholine metabolism protein LicD
MNITLLELAELAKKIGIILERHGLPFYLTGGVVAAHYGEIRNTQDVDIVVNMAICEDVTALFDDLKKEFLIDKTAFDDAIRLKSMFQILDVGTMLRADIYTEPILPDCFQNVVSVDMINDIWLPISSPEDSILSKLVWIKLGSERSRKDIVAMLRVQTNLNNKYLETCTEKLGVTEILKELRIIADSCNPNNIL